jgi:diketogulonate reductase-like aldo/keto reductase
VEFIYGTGNVRAIGVSNFEVNHLEDIFELKSLIPSVNQVWRLGVETRPRKPAAVICQLPGLESRKPAVHPFTLQFEFHPYWHEDDLVAYCNNRSILVNGYSPLGARDLSPQRYAHAMLHLRYE